MLATIIDAGFSMLRCSYAIRHADADFSPYRYFRHVTSLLMPPPPDARQLPRRYGSAPLFACADAAMMLSVFAP